MRQWEQPRLHGLSFVLRDVLVPSASADLDVDQLGKTISTLLRARYVGVPAGLVL